MHISSLSFIRIFIFTFYFRLSNFAEHICFTLSMASENTSANFLLLPIYVYQVLFHLTRTAIRKKAQLHYFSKHKFISVFFFKFVAQKGEKKSLFVYRGKKCNTLIWDYFCVKFFLLSLPLLSAAQFLSGFISISPPFFLHWENF